MTADKQNELIERASIITEALPYISRYRGKTIVIKYGGNAMNNPDVIRTVMQDVATLKIVGVAPVLVHGGGPEINSMLSRLGIKSEVRNGLRVTDAATMEIVQMALSKLNKNIAAALGTLGVKAVGVSGMDDGLVRVEKYSDSSGADYGYVGKIKSVNTAVLDTLISNDYIPAIATIGADDCGKAYNVNADTAAAKLAIAMGAEKLLLLTDVRGLLTDPEDEATLIPHARASEVPGLVKDGVIRGGMIPKIDCAVEAVRSGVRSTVILDGRIPHSILIELLSDAGVGTMITV